MYQWKRFSSRVRESFHAFCHSHGYFHLDRIIKRRNRRNFYFYHHRKILSLIFSLVIKLSVRDKRDNPSIPFYHKFKCVENLLLNKSIAIIFKDNRYTKIYSSEGKLAWKVLTQVDADWLTVCRKSGEHILFCDYGGRLDRYRNVPKSVVEPWNLSRIREFGSIPLRLFYLPRITPDTVSLFSKNILTASRTALVSYSLPALSKKGV